jgi:gamma-glutamyl-gamma-aminobutyrate hydrolase PuuD
MAINITIGKVRRPTAAVVATIRNANGSLSLATPLTVTSSSVVNKLGSMADVVVAGGVDGDPLVYHPSTENYTVEHLSANNILNPIDAGSF